MFGNCCPPICKLISSGFLSPLVLALLLLVQLLGRICSCCCAAFGTILLTLLPLRADDDDNASCGSGCRNSAGSMGCCWAAAWLEQLEEEEAPEVTPMGKAVTVAAMMFSIMLCLLLLFFFDDDDDLVFVVAVVFVAVLEDFEVDVVDVLPCFLFICMQAFRFPRTNIGWETCPFISPFVTRLKPYPWSCLRRLLYFVCRK